MTVRCQTSTYIWRISSFFWILGNLERKTQIDWWFHVVYSYIRDNMKHNIFEAVDKLLKFWDFFGGGRDETFHIFTSLFMREVYGSSIWCIIMSNQQATTRNHEISCCDVVIPTLQTYLWILYDHYITDSQWEHFYRVRKYEKFLAAYWEHILYPEICEKDITMSSVRE